MPMATGTIGNGHGTAAYFGLEKEVDIQLGTLSKSLGSVGGYVAGNSTIIDYLVNTSRSFIFSTALSPADIGAALAALHILESDVSVLRRLHENVNYMADQLIPWELMLPMKHQFSQSLLDVTRIH